MYIRRKVFSTFIDTETGEERLFSTTEIMSEEEYLKLYSETLEQREYGVKSKVLGILAPGSYQAKEAAKYGYDNEKDYKKKRVGYALKGFFAPGVSTYIKKKAEQMAKEGKSTEEIREYLENRGKYHSTGRVLAGITEAGTAPATGGLYGAGLAAAYGVGLYDKITGKRKKFKKD